MFEFAALAARLGEHDAAISTLERMLIYNPELPRVRLELGALYMSVGADEMARVYLQDALTDADLPPPVRARTDTLLAEEGQRTARHITAGAGFGGRRFHTHAHHPTDG